MESNKNQHNSQTALFAIAIILALGVGFYMGYQTGFVNGGQEMHEHMHAEEEHGHSMAESSGVVSTSEAMNMMEHSQ